MDALLYSVNDRFPEIKLLALRTHRYRGRADLRRALSWFLRLSVGREPSGRLRSIPVDRIADRLDLWTESEAEATFRQGMLDWSHRNSAFFIEHGVSCVEELRVQAENYTLPLLLNLRRFCHVQAFLLQQLQPALVLSPFSWGIARPVGKVSKRCGIPAMVIPSKTLAVHDDKLATIGEKQIGLEIVTNDYAYAAVQSPMTEAYLRALSIRAR